MLNDPFLALKTDLGASETGASSNFGFHAVNLSLTSAGYANTDGLVVIVISSGNSTDSHHLGSNGILELGRGPQRSMWSAVLKALSLLTAYYLHRNQS